MKSATLFSGFEGAGVGMRAAGYEHTWGLEYDDSIAAVTRMNGFNTLTLNILDADPTLFEKVDLLHASPPCPNFSVAKANGVETELDIALARKTADFIEVLRPKCFTLENVYQYRNSQSWAIISNRLYTCGYWLDFEHCNFADLGVPQTRQRMIVRAVHNGFVPYMPKKEKWVGWYRAIEDLIPTLPPSKFAPWQIERLPRHISTSFLAMPNAGNGKKLRERHEPADTVVTSSFGGGNKAFIVDCQKNGTVESNNALRHLTIRDEREPVFAMTAAQNKLTVRAWLSHGKVVKMTPRALARFQSFPDWYQLPEKNALACKGIGNACPPLGMAKIYKGLITL